MDREFMDRLARALGITPEDQEVLDAGSAHPFTCRCDTCRHWWKKVGPQNPDEVADGEPADFGPFTPDEIGEYGGGE
jgi:hypothetical protein